MFRRISGMEKALHGSMMIMQSMLLTTTGQQIEDNRHLEPAILASDGMVAATSILLVFVIFHIPKPSASH